MSYNRWMPEQYQNGGELYHHGVKGMKWGHHKSSSLKIEAQEATITGSSGGGGAQEYVEPEPDDPDATAKAYEKWQESQKPEWQKKWEKSDTKKTLDGILSKIRNRGKKGGAVRRENRPTGRRRNVTGKGTGNDIRR